MTSQHSIREQITNQIVDALKSDDLLPWRRPWALDKNAGHPTNVVSKKGYRGINPLLLRPIAAFLLLLLCLIGTSLSLYTTKATMRRLMEELQSKAVAAAMNGDEVRMLEAVRDAQSTGATKAWAESVKAICALFSGDTERARELLTSAIDNSEDTLTVHALLALSHMGAGDVEGYANECIYLLKRKPTKHRSGQLSSGRSREP